MKNKSTKILILSTILLCSIFYIVCNQNIEGVYVSCLGETIDSESRSFIVFEDSKVYIVACNETEINSVEEVGTYSFESGKYNINIFSNRDEIEPTFFLLNWKKYQKYLDGRPLPHGELSRVFNPILKHKIYKKI